MMMGFISGVIPILLVVALEAGPPNSPPRGRAGAVDAFAGKPGTSRMREGHSSKRPSRVTPEREAAARTFVRRHHPELAELLNYLKENQPRRYRHAVWELFRTSERLAGIQERDPDRHAVELHAWRLKSRTELLAARLQINDDAAVRGELRKTLRELLDVQKERLQQERERLHERLRKLESQIERLETDQQHEVDRRLHAIVSRRHKKSTNDKPNSGVRKTRAPQRKLQRAPARPKPNEKDGQP